MANLLRVTETNSHTKITFTRKLSQVFASTIQQGY
jgi:hypothetical protein